MAGLGDIRGAKYLGAPIGPQPTAVSQQAWVLIYLPLAWFWVALGRYAAALRLTPRMSPEAAGAASPPLFRCARHSPPAHWSGRLFMGRFEDTL